MPQAVPPALRSTNVPTIPRPCDAQEQNIDGDIVVCGRRDSSRYRLPPLSPIYEAERRKAERQIGNGAIVSAETERVEIGGMPSNRAMIRLKIKF